MEALATHLGHGVTSVSDMETGARPPPADPEKVRAIATYLGEPPTPFLEAAALVREQVCLTTRQPLHASVGAALLSAWDSLPKSALLEIRSVVDRYPPED